MSKIINKIREDQLVKDITETLTQEEKKDLEKWMKEYILPLDNMLDSLRDLMSTEKSSEMLADAINHIFTEEGAEEVKKCLQEKSSEAS
jgi:intergrase/recombinase